MFIHSKCYRASAFSLRHRRKCGMRNGECGIEITAIFHNFFPYFRIFPSSQSFFHQVSVSHGFFRNTGKAWMKSPSQSFFHQVSVSHTNRTCPHQRESRQVAILFSSSLSLPLHPLFVLMSQAFASPIPVTSNFHQILVVSEIG